MNSKKGLTGSALKIIAISTMLIDHIGAVVLEKYIIKAGIYNIEAANFFEAFNISDPCGLTYIIMRLIGRVAFPVFCFLLIEGFLHTRSVAKYALRLGAFGLISEVAFDLAFHGKPFYWQYQNVFWTLLLGLLAIWGIKLLSEKLDGRINRVLLIIINIILVAAASFTAELLKTDYGMTGILTIVVMYIMRKSRVREMLGGCIVLTVLNPIEITSFFAVLLAAKYNGERGLKHKYMFYMFYPAHLLVLALICRLLVLA